MDNFGVMLTSRAIRDLDGIYAYIAKTLLEPEIALKLVDEIEEAIFSLEQFPYRCPGRKTGAYASRGYRQLLIKNYTAVYRVDETKRHVVILTVRYSPSQF